MTRLFAVLFVPAVLLAGIGFVWAGNDRAASCSVAAAACDAQAVAAAVADKAARENAANRFDAAVAFAFNTGGFAGGECDDGSCEASAQLTRAGEAPSPLTAACDADKQDCDKPAAQTAANVSFVFNTAAAAGGECDDGACDASAGISLAAEQPLAAGDSGDPAEACDADCEKECCNDKAGVLRHTMTDIHGNDVDLSKYEGKAILMVNVASECGFTPQYEGLQDLHERYADKGLVVLGFPCNQFGGQEPGTEQEIVEFCEANYGVTFDLFAKIDVNGDDAAPLYKDLTSDSAPIEDTGEIRWNFEKFLIDREGQVIARFRSRVEPTSETMIEAIEAAL